VPAAGDRIASRDPVISSELGTNEPTGVGGRGLRERTRSTAPAVSSAGVHFVMGSAGVTSGSAPSAPPTIFFSPYLALYSEIGLYRSPTVSELCRYFAGTCAFGYQGARIMPSTSAHLLAVMGAPASVSEKSPCDIGNRKGYPGRGIPNICNGAQPYRTEQRFSKRRRFAWLWKDRHALSRTPR
jgi:hypothetical protein